MDSKKKINFKQGGGSGRHKSVSEPFDLNQSKNTKSPHYDHYCQITGNQLADTGQMDIREESIEPELVLSPAELNSFTGGVHLGEEEGGQSRGWWEGERMRPDVLERREGRVWRGGALPGSGLLRKAGDKVICGVSGGRWGCSQGHQEIIRGEWLLSRGAGLRWNLYTLHCPCKGLQPPDRVDEAGPGTWPGLARVRGAKSLVSLGRAGRDPVPRLLSLPVWDPGC